MKRWATPAQHEKHKIQKLQDEMQQDDSPVIPMSCTEAPNCTEPAANTLCTAPSTVDQPRSEPSQPNSHGDAMTGIAPLSGETCQTQQSTTQLFVPRSYASTWDTDPEVFVHC
eukprot:TRINITY_DN2232_c0_g1_i1.p1 TRINITY_DN2232_c0_g1~~TRINITY_DN2232_c0_g1_i1.p1  ORF type:complete len:113 (-),score=20.05 TRINITY_DN2232_c0_g1_i1:104-442(-)